MEITLSADSFLVFCIFLEMFQTLTKTQTNLGRLTFSTTSCGSNTSARSRILTEARLCQEIKNICFSVLKL